MPKLVTAGAMMTCSFGVAPRALVVTPENKLLAGAPGASYPKYSTRFGRIDSTLG